MKLHFYPFNVFFSIPIPEVPIDLIELVKSSKNIRRLNDPTYPESVFFDNNKAHTFRLVSTVIDTDLSDTEKDILTRMLWIHDLPKVELYENEKKDMTSVAKETNLALSSRIDKSEVEIAQRIFAQSDFELYEEFKRGELLLNGDTGNLSKLTPLGIIGKIIDTTDENMSFHYFLSKWLKTEKYNPFEIPQESTLIFSFNYFKNTVERLNTINNLRKDIKEESLLLLMDHMTFILECWKDVDNIPLVIKNNIDDIKSQFHF